MRQAGGQCFRRAGSGTRSGGRSGRLLLLGLSLLALEACSSSGGVYQRMAETEGGVVANGLPADRAHAAYTDIALVGGTETPAPPPRALDYTAAAPAENAPPVEEAEQSDAPGPEAMPSEAAAAPLKPERIAEQTPELAPAPSLEPAMETPPPDPLAAPPADAVAEAASVPPPPAMPAPVESAAVPPPPAYAPPPGAPNTPGSYEPLPLPDAPPAYVPPPAYAPPPPPVPPPAMASGGPVGATAMNSGPMDDGVRPLRGFQPVPPAADIPIAPVPRMAGAPAASPYENRAPSPLGAAAPAPTEPSQASAPVYGAPVYGAPAYVPPAYVPPAYSAPALPPAPPPVAGRQNLDAIAAETYARRLQESTPAESAPALPGSLSPSAAYLSEPDLPRRSSDLALPAGNEPAAVLRFAYGSARLGAEDLELLREVAEVYRARGGRLRVVGHSSGDSSSGQGSARPTLARISANFAQSQERADAVAEALRAYGVPAEALLVEARGDSAPLYRETTPAGAFGNRRVEIFLE